MRRSRTSFGVLFAGAVVGLAALLIGAVACGSDGNNVSGCQQIESARCVRAQSCGIDLQFPLHTGDTEADAIQACQLLYQDACLHGFVTSVSVSGTEVGHCVTAIQTTADCNVVLNPQTFTACAFLNPPDAGSDASDATTTTPDVTVIYVEPDATINDGAADAIAACENDCFSTCEGDSACIDQCEGMCTGS